MVNIIGILDCASEEDNIIEWFISNQYKFTKHDDIKIDSKEKLHDLIEFYEKAVIENCNKIDKNWAIFLCYCIISKTAYNKAFSTASIHIICQIAIGFLIDVKNNSKCKNKDLIKFIFSDLINVINLKNIDSSYDFFPDIDLLEFKNNHLCFLESHIEFMNNYKSLMSDRGERQRFSKSTNDMIFKHLEEFIDEINKMKYSRKKISQIVLFKDNLYKYLPDYTQETREFWDGLLARLQFLCNCTNMIGIYNVTKNSTNRDFRETMFAFDVNKIEGAKKFILDENNINQCKEKDDFSYNITFKYPLVPLHDNLYASSFYILGDSINAYVEEQIYYNYKEDKTRVEWSDKVCKSLSKIFENKIVELFKNKGYLAGEVTAKGAWKANNFYIEKDGQKVPGQIDVLAIKNNKIFIVECKVYNDIIKLKRLKNLNSYFDIKKDRNEIDKLLNKADFILSSNIYDCIEYKNKDAIDIIPMIVTDIPMPVIINIDRLIDTRNLKIYDLEKLQKYLNEC